MADETIIETTPTTTEPQPSRANERITELSDKVKTEAEARQKAETERAAAESRAAFAEGFADVVAANPAAKDHKDEIKDKVLKGYTVEDATYAVLGKAGKLGSAPAPAAQVAGGSAPTTAVVDSKKEPGQMSQAERRAQLEKDLLWQ